MNEFLAGAHSVFSFIESTAEKDGEGYRWKTYDYQDQPRYHFNIFNGVGGIPIFLGAYFEITQCKQALELARGAIHWCIRDQPEEGGFQRGLQFGKTGVAYAALYLSGITGEESLPGFCGENAAHILAEKPGPITDFIGGEASNGWFFLRLWERTGAENHLAGAGRCAEWIAQHLITDERGTHCLVDPVHHSFGTKQYTGLSHGIAGVAGFYVLLSQADRNPRWRDIAQALLKTLRDGAIADKGGLNWAPVLGATELTRCQYSHGAPGIGLVFLQAARTFGDGSFLQTALQAGEATYQNGDFRKNPTLCTGLAGGGELLIELFRETRNGLWLERAEEFAGKALAYGVKTEQGDLWPTDTPGCYSADFTYGASGTGYFFLRTFAPDRLGPPLI